MRERGEWDGLAAIVRFNWPWYGIAGVLAAVAVGVLLSAPAPILRVVAWSIAIGSAWFVFASSFASHWVYDRSDLYRFAWLQRVGIPLRDDRTPRFVFCHAGFDESSALLAQALPEADWRIFDHHAAATMTEPSIRRARSHSVPGVGTDCAPFDAWPLADHSIDAVFAILAIHELRRRGDRTRWFEQARRCLAPAGRVMLVEHVRDLANVLAFGPGALHFHAASTWQRDWESAGLVCRDRFRITPFVRVFVLGAP